MESYEHLPTNELMTRREAMEAEMQAIGSRLSAPNAPGLRGSLVDREGFPIAGCDLYAVRADRGRYNALRNDYERITDAIQKRVIEQMSGEGRVDRVTTKLAATTTKQSTEEAKTDAPRMGGDVLDEDAGRAFAVIDEVIEGSPGHIDGLQVGDRVCAVGEVRWAFSDPSAEPPAELIPNAARTFGANENSAVRVVVLRRGDRVTLSVTPRAWSGRGLVGCHMRSV